MGVILRILQSTHQQELIRGVDKQVKKRREEGRIRQIEKEEGVTEGASMEGLRQEMCLLQEEL